MCGVRYGGRRVPTARAQRAVNASPPPLRDLLPDLMAPRRTLEPKT